MKGVIFTIIGIFYCLFASAQAPTPTYQGTTYGWVQYRGIYGADSGQVFLPTDTGSRGEPIGTLRLKSSNKEYYTWDGSKWKWILANAAGGGSSIDTTSLSNRIDQKAGYADTASMLSPYATKQRLSDTAAALRSAIASATPSIDTTIYSTRAWRMKGDDSLGVIIGTKVGYADTAAMLSPYVRGSRLADTAAALRAAIGSGGSSSIAFSSQTFANPLHVTGKKKTVSLTGTTTIYVDSSANGDVGMIDIQNPSLYTVRLDGIFKSGLPRSTNDLLTWVNVAGTIKWDVTNFNSTSGVYNAVPPPGDTLTFASRSAGFTGYTGNYSAAGSTAIATSTEYLSGEGYIQFDCPTSGVFAIGLDVANTLETWLTGTTVNYDYSIYFASTNVYANKAGEDLSAAAVTAIGSGDVMRFGRNSSSQIYLSLSTDGGSTFSTIYTFSGTFTSGVYIKCSGFSGTGSITNLRRFF